jgi:hypothetical protein
MEKVFLDANAMLSILAVQLHLYEGAACAPDGAAPLLDPRPYLANPTPTPGSMRPPQAPPQNRHNLSALPPDLCCGAAKDAA